MASSKKKTTSLTPDDVNKEINPIQKNDQNQEIDLNKEPNPEEDKAKKEGTKKKKLVVDFEDDSEETRELLRRWKKTPPKPLANIVRNAVKCSRAIRKQLTESDVLGERLVLPKSQVKKHFLPLLNESEIPRGKEGIKVLVYGPNGKVRREMKMWADEKMIELVTGWKKFVGDYELKEICDFITVWMFRDIHKRICFAIDRTRLSLRNQVSKRISMELENSDE